MINPLILQGNVLDTLKTIPLGSVRCVVTSPPYYGLRSYLKSNDPLKEYEIGTEATPELYINKLVDVFRLVWDALADDGTFWLNLGDSFASNTKGRGGPSKKQESNKGSWYSPTKFNHGLKEKDLMMIPARVALALQADGWYLRSEIVWHKPNPMPESVKDRPTRSHEMIYLLSKSEKYYYDYEAIYEPANYDGRKDTMMKGSEKYKNGFAPTDENPNSLHIKGHERWKRKNDGTNNGGNGSGFQNHSGYDNLENPYIRNKRDVWTVTTKPYSGAHFATFPPDLIEPCILAGSAINDTVLDPFGGSGTTASVAIKHNRKAIVCELNNEYIPLINKRMSEVQPVLFSR